MEKWSENVKKLEDSCREKINAMNISNEDKPIAEFLCITYGKQEKKMPTKEEIEKMISNKSLRLLTPGPRATDYKPQIDLILRNPANSKEISLSNVYFDSGANV